MTRASETMYLEMTIPLVLGVVPEEAGTLC